MICHTKLTLSHQLILVKNIANVPLADRFSTPMRLQKTKSQFVQILSITFGKFCFVWFLCLTEIRPCAVKDLQSLAIKHEKITR